MNIRQFQKNDYEVIKMWWYLANEPSPTIEMLPEESTFVLEIDNAPQACITVYLTNTNYLAYLENLVRNPKLQNNKNHIEILVKHAENFTKKLGYKILLCMSYKEKLKKRYEEMGYMNTLNNLSSFGKEL